MRVSGRVASLRVGYQLAAELERWALEPTGRRGYAFRATVVRTQPYWILQRPLDLVLVVGSVEWTWRDVAATLTTEEISVSLITRPEVTARVAPSATRQGAAV